MEITNNDYVSYELAKKLLNMGFPQELDNYEIYYPLKDIVTYNKTTCVSYPLKEGEPYNVAMLVCDGFTLSQEEIEKTDFVFCPPLYIVEKWLRDDYGYSIVIESSAKDNHSYWVNDINEEVVIDAYYVTPHMFKTYEEALKDAIMHCLEFIENR